MLVELCLGKGDFKAYVQVLESVVLFHTVLVYHQNVNKSVGAIFQSSIHKSHQHQAPHHTHVSNKLSK